MQTNKNVGKSFLSYLLIFSLFAMAVNGFMSMMTTKGPDYSQIRQYFNLKQVEYFVLEGSDLTITLKEKDENGKAKAVYYELADPEGFMNSYDFDAQIESGALTGYDHKPGPEDSALYDWMPTLLTLGV